MEEYRHMAKTKAKAKAPAKETGADQKATRAEQQRLWHQRKRAAGYARMSLWVPEDLQDQVKAYADKAIKKWEKGR